LGVYCLGFKVYSVSSENSGLPEMGEWLLGVWVWALNPKTNNPHTLK
jgi:hypothetical protein